jgi:hypothetical protein
MSLLATITYVYDDMLTEIFTWQDEVVTRIEERISAWTFLPPGTSKTSIKLLNPFRLVFPSF